MKQLFLSLIVLLVFACQFTEANKDLSLKSNNLDKKNNYIPELINYSVNKEHDVVDELYTIDLKSILKAETSYDLFININLKNGGHFVSPNAKGDFSGKFTFQINETNAFNFVGNLIESPLSVEEIDLHPFVNGPVNWVRVNTNYKQGIKLNTTEDFLVIGYIQFTIEPRCTLEKIPLIIKQKNGKFRFELDKC